MKPPNHGLPVRVTTPSDEGGPEIVIEGYLALDRHPRGADPREAGLVLLPEGLIVYTTDRIEML